jgi:uncharacterized membrane protein YecN with MAPEG domain
MGLKLKKLGITLLSVTAVFLLYAVLLAAFVELALDLAAIRQAAAHQRILLIIFDLGLLVVWSGFLPAIALRHARVAGIGPYLLTGVVSGFAAEYMMLFALHVGCDRAPFHVAYGDPGNYAGPHTISALFLEVFRRIPIIGQEIATYSLPTVIVLAGFSAMIGGVFWWSTVLPRRGNHPVD